MKLISRRIRVASLFCLLTFNVFCAYSQKGYTSYGNGYKKRSAPTTNLDTKVKTRTTHTAYESPEYVVKEELQEYKRKSAPISAATNSTPLRDHAEVKNDASSNSTSYKVKSAPQQTTSSIATR